MSKVHLVLQGKGGVGKSFVASMIAQFKRSRGQTPLCIDTDPINSTFSGYSDLNVRRIELLEGDEINPRNFDVLVELIAASKDDAVVDNGASSYQPLLAYLIQNDVASVLADFGHELVLHTVVTGGQALLDTLHGFGQIASQFPDGASIVVWLNPYWGPIEMEGRGFEAMKTYRDNKSRVAAIVTVPKLQEATFGRDLSDMLQERSTFEQAIASPSLSIMSRNRLKQTRDKIFGELEKAAVI